MTAVAAPERTLCGHSTVESCEQCEHTFALSSQGELREKSSIPDFCVPGFYRLSGAWSRRYDNSRRMQELGGNTPRPRTFNVEALETWSRESLTKTWVSPNETNR